MQQIRYTNELDETILLGIEAPFILQRISGTGNISANHRTSTIPFQDGQVHNGTSLNSRYITINGTIKASSQKELFKYREWLCSIFNPKLKGKLEYITGHETKLINAKIEETPSFSEYRGDAVSFLISIVCHEPYWHDIENSIHTFTTPYTSLFEFPFSFESDSFEMGYQTEIVTFTNNGDVETPLFLEFEGGIKNVKLTNKTNGEWIEIKKKLQSDERLIINSNVGEKEVSIIKNNGETRNGFGLITLDCSTFMHLSKGENVLEYVAESDSGLAVLHLKWNSRYLGV